MDTIVDIDVLLGQRLKSMRQRRSMSVSDLAAASGVSRAMIARIERSQASPTAVLLAKLANGLNTTTASLFAVEDDQSPLLRAADQRQWQDPATGYRRKNVSPASASVELVEVVFPAGARVVFDNMAKMGSVSQLIWILQGTMVLTVNGTEHILETGDCLTMSLGLPLIFENRTVFEARYALILSAGRSIS